MSCCGNKGGGCCATRTGSCPKKNNSCARNKKPLDCGSLSSGEADFLDYLACVQYLPVAKAGVDGNIIPVYIEQGKDDVASVNATGEMLAKLAGGGFITLDYNIKLSNYDYKEYYESEYYQSFEEKIDMELGSMCPSYEYLLLIDDSDIFTSPVAEN